MDESDIAGLIALITIGGFVALLISLKNNGFPTGDGGGEGYDNETTDHDIAVTPKMPGPSQRYRVDRNGEIFEDD